MVTLVTLTTLASLIPLAIGTDPDKLFGSIALATVGGTVGGTLAALVTVPALLLLGRARLPSRRRLALENARGLALLGAASPKPSELRSYRGGSAIKRPAQ
jgi:hypothetical protein